MNTQYTNERIYVLVLLLFIPTVNNTEVIIYSITTHIHGNTMEKYSVHHGSHYILENIVKNALWKDIGI